MTVSKQRIELLKTQIGKVEDLLKMKPKRGDDHLLIFNGHYVLIYRNGNTVTNMQPVPSPMMATWIPKKIAEQLASHAKEELKIDAKMVHYVDALKDFIERCQQMIQVIEAESDIKQIH